MPSITEVSASQRLAYQRPYKTRSERREIARRKHDENADYKFLVRAAMVVGVLLLVAIGVATKSALYTDDVAPLTTQALH